MSNPLERIKQARQLLEIGEITEEIFNEIKSAAMAEMGMVTKPSVPSGVVGGATIVGEPSDYAQSSQGNPFDRVPTGAGLGLGGATTIGVTGLEIGQYKVLELLGEGGMGSVYRGRHKNDVMAEAEGDVAIKLIKPELAKDLSLRARFVKEAALGKKIVHPNIGKVITYHEDDNHTAFIMEYIEGKDLKSLIPSKGLDPDKALSLLRPLAEAIDFLHSKGVIHRDLKPANIKIRPDGSPVILDFGIAKEENAESGSMTKTGTTMGTDVYMAPEQMNAKVVGPKADQYSFAMIVYEMLSGRLPWDSGTTGAMITVAKMTSGLKPLEAVSSLDDRYGKVVSRGLSLESMSRYDSCVMLVDALEQSGQGPSPEELARIEAEHVEHERLAELERERIESECRIQAERKRQVETAKREAEKEQARKLAEQQSRKEVKPVVVYHNDQDKFKMNFFLENRTMQQVENAIEISIGSRSKDSAQRFDIDSLGALGLGGASKLKQTSREQNRSVFEGSLCPQFWTERFPNYAYIVLKDDGRGVEVDFTLDISSWNRAYWPAYVLSFFLFYPLVGLIQIFLVRPKAIKGLVLLGEHLRKITS